MPYQIKSRLIYSIFAVAVLSACANTSTDNAADAANCLNTATAATAQSCYNLTAGSTTIQSNLVRCAAILIRQGYSSASLLQSVSTTMSSSTTSQNPNVSVMTLLGFHYYSNTAAVPNSSDVADAVLAATQCANSGSSGLSMLGGLGATSTQLLYLLAQASTTPTTSNITTYLSSNASTVANQSGVTTALSTAYTQNCSGSTATYSSYCTQYAAAVSASGGSTSSTATVTYFLQNLK